MVGVPAVLAASWAAHRLGTGERWTISAWGVVRFLPLFVWESLRGGIDVARRTLAPRLRIRPGFINYQLGLTAAKCSCVFCKLRLPAARHARGRPSGRPLSVHMLDSGIDPQADLRRLEQAVALVYGQSEYEPGDTVS